MDSAIHCLNNNIGVSMYFILPYIRFVIFNIAAIPRQGKEILQKCDK